MTHKDYRHRDVLDKLGIKPAQVVAIDDPTGRLGAELTERVRHRIGRSLAAESEVVDVAIVMVDVSTDVVDVLTHWRGRITSDGGIWLLTRKRGHVGYVDQNALIAAGPAAGLVDNKVCSFSDLESALRFVIRRADRPGRR
ncbi:MAG: DUF3052 family protein [Chloroflexi bacterium]|nr:DUF3052 family protein [Chloroflexota bacterium]